MSVAYRCNRCAALFDPEDTRHGNDLAPMEIRALPIKRPKNIEQVTSIPLHFCGSCSTAFQAFLTRATINPLLDT